LKISDNAPYPRTQIGRNYTPVEPVRCVLPEAPCREQMISADFQSVPIITGEATLPLRCLPPAYPFVDLPTGNILRCKLFPSSKFTIMSFIYKVQGL